MLCNIGYLITFIITMTINNTLLSEINTILAFSLYTPPTARRRKGTFLNNNTIPKLVKKELTTTIIPLPGY